eukprot:Hpha_TRINITY_DN29757_c0_g1::TRINITY_DN29757_c0_g1_i1::g.2522::m.2522
MGTVVCRLSLLAALCGVVSAAARYRSILGDPGMRWGGGAGPRMQLFFYDLCSKAGDANSSIIPAPGDTCAHFNGSSAFGIGEVERVPAPAGGCCQACLGRPWCLAFASLDEGSTCSLKDNVRPLPMSATQRQGGRRVVQPAQRLPAPRYANCVVRGMQTISPKDNAAQVEPTSTLDVEWFTVQKEHQLAEKCAVDHGASGASSFFWTTMSQNGNAPSTLGTPEACLPQCYYGGDATHHDGWPPAVNASMSRCPPVTAEHRLTFNNRPMNQAQVLVGYTDPGDPQLVGRFNWSFELEEDLAVPETTFPMNKSLGVWEWRQDPQSQRGIVRVYQRVSAQYSWICTYFGVDAARGIKGNQAYDGRGMMLETPTSPDFLVRFWLNITNAQIKGGGIGSWYAPNMEACWDTRTRKPCRPYGDTNTMVHQQVLLDYGGDDSCTRDNPQLGCPRYHRWRNGSTVHRNSSWFPYDAYKFYCGPCQSCDEMLPGERCCDPFSNSNGQSIYKLAPHPEWAFWGFPENATDGFVGHPKMHELNVGGLFTQIWFPCMTTEPIEIVTVNIGPETGYGTGTHDTEFFVADFDVLIPDV